MKQRTVHSNGTAIKVHAEKPKQLGVLLRILTAIVGRGWLWIFLAVSVHAASPTSIGPVTIVQCVGTDGVTKESCGGSASSAGGATTVTPGTGTWRTDGSSVTAFLAAGSNNIGTVNGSTVGAIIIGTPNVNVVSQSTLSVSGSTVTAQINALPALIAGTANIGTVNGSTVGAVIIGTPNVNVVSQATTSVSGSTVTAQINALPSLIAGAANIGTVNGSTVGAVIIGTPNVNVVSQATTSVSGSTVTAQINTLPALVAGSANIGTVNGSTVGATILGTPNVNVVSQSTSSVSGSTVTAQINALPALVAGTANIGTVSGSTVTGYAISPARVPWIMISSNTAGTVAETLVSLVVSRSFAATGAAATSLTVTAGKILHIQGLCATWRNTTLLSGGATVRFRVNTPSVVVGTSTIIGTASVSIASGTFRAGITACVPLSDGIELSGSNQIGCTQSASDTSAGLDVNGWGYEYTPY